MVVALQEGSIEFHFPEVHESARMTVTFHRTVRVPDDGQRYGLPAGLGHFPLRRVADLPAAPVAWQRVGGVAMPMWQSEACWMSFSSWDGYPFLVTVGAGGVNAVTGGPWRPDPSFDEEDYFEVPEQPWLDGFCTDSGVVRQFVAMPLGSGYTAEEQVTGRAAVGGLQIAVIPLKASVFREREVIREESIFPDECMPAPSATGMDMGMGAGGSITQSVATPVEPQDNWESSGSSVSVHIVNSAHWVEVTGAEPPTLPLSAADYTRCGMPWFDWYDDTLARAGSTTLADVVSVGELDRELGRRSLPENESFEPPEPVILGPAVTT